MSWDEIKAAFLRGFKAPEFADMARTELVSLRQADKESVTLYHLRMQGILSRWQDHGLPGSLVKGLFVDGLREEFREWVAVEIAMDWEGAKAVRRMREEWRRMSIGRDRCADAGSISVGRSMRGVKAPLIPWRQRLRSRLVPLVRFLVYREFAG